MINNVVDYTALSSSSRGSEKVGESSYVIFRSIGRQKSDNPTNWLDQDNILLSSIYVLGPARAATIIVHRTTNNGKQTSGNGVLQGCYTGRQSSIGKKFIHVHEVLNFRDMGGCLTADGAFIRRCLVYRSADLSKLNEEGLSQLRKLGIRKIIDLRSSSEIESNSGSAVYNPSLSSTHDP